MVNWCNSLLWLDQIIWSSLYIHAKSTECLFHQLSLIGFTFLSCVLTYSCVIATVKKEEFISILPPPAHCLPAGLYTHPQYMLRVRNRRNRNFFNTCKKTQLTFSFNRLIYDEYILHILVPSLMGASGYIFKVSLLHKVAVIDHLHEVSRGFFW